LSGLYQEFQAKTRAAFTSIKLNDRHLRLPAWWPPRWRPEEVMFYVKVMRISLTRYVRPAIGLTPMARTTRRCFT